MLTALSDSLPPEALGNLAHELRTPVQALIGRLEMLQEEYSDEIGSQPTELIRQMSVNAFELQQTVENLLIFLAGRAGAEVDVQEYLTVQGIVADVEPAIALANSTKQLPIRYDLSEAPEAIRAPRRAVTATIINLAVNAIKFTESGTITIAIRQVYESTREATIEFEVSDSGPGLNPALLEEMSQPFTQFSRSSTRRFRGVGLGLAVVQQNVRILGGTLELRSAPGHGATFLVRFPQEQHQDPQIEPNGMANSRSSKMQFSAISNGGQR
jgi:signal transduction histidine kinase